MEIIKKIIRILKEKEFGVNAVIEFWLEDCKTKSESFYQLYGMVWTMFGLGLISENEHKLAIDYLIKRF